MGVPANSVKTTKVTLYSFNALLLIILVVFLVGAVTFLFNKKNIEELSQKKDDLLSSVLGDGDGDESKEDGSGINQSGDEISGSVQKVINRFNENNSDNELPEIEKVIETVQNSDGTYTKLFSKTYGDIEEVIFETYDKFGNKLSEGNVELEGEESAQNGTTQTDKKIYDLFGSKLINFKLESADGKVNLKVDSDFKVQNAKVEYYPEKGLVTIITDDANEEGIKHQVRIITSDESLEIYKSGSGVSSKFPLKIDPENGKIVVETGSGEFSLNITPDSLTRKIESSELIDDYENIYLDEMDGKVVYKVEGNKQQRLAGIFSILIPSTLVYDVESGLLVKTEQDLLFKIVDAVSL